MKGGVSMLTAKQEKFVQNLINGMNQADAYRNAYSCNNMSDSTIWSNASRLAADSKVSARLSELRERLAAPSIMTAQKRLEWLTEVINSEKENTGDKLRAIDLMNKMQGEYVQKIEAEVTKEVNINIELCDDE
jgi:phage terminase small subunit